MQIKSKIQILKDKIIKFFRKIFIKKEEIMNSQKKWGVIIPHTKDNPGAWSSDRKYNEYSYALKMVELMPFAWAKRDIGGVRNASIMLRKNGCVNSIEPHKNAFNKEVEGFEVLVLEGDQESIDFAKNISKKFKKSFPSKRIRGKEGVKIVKRNQRGYINLLIAKESGMEIAILTESFFIDNEKDWIDIEEMASFWKSVLI